MYNNKGTEFVKNKEPSTSPDHIDTSEFVKNKEPSTSPDQLSTTKINSSKKIMITDAENGPNI